ncbi:hypothetical protein H4R20_003742 [Coemansia guatemalensis]|uniref:Uncharacterized protein n=1 Tax=Coemansia guatemalensis TaxID=2761395 RepID=A0A9W8HT73_9FUNG|nr:hypothetical protein H4R20_003742 [Coemansia guatemalensis]
MEGNAGDSLDQSIHRLLDEIGERRKQAAHLAQLVEQSIYQPQSTPRNFYRPYSPPAINKAPPVLVDSSTDASFVDCRSSSASPPASFLEDFTRAFVDSYKHPHASADGLQTDDLQVHRPYRMILPARGRSPSQRSTAYLPAAGRCPVRDILSVHENSGGNSGLALEPLHLEDRLLESMYSESECDLEPNIDRGLELECKPEPKAEHKQESDSEHSGERELRGMSVIDRKARARMWQRVGSNRALAQGTEDHDEAHIKAIVQLAEQTSAIKTQDVGENTLELPGGTLDSISPQPLPRSDLPNKEPAMLTPASADPQHLDCWSESEWERWADYAQQNPTLFGTVDREQMVQRLDWVHEQQTDAWKHGFSDTMLTSGKLRRTYQGLPLDLQAYPDGNVKRTAAVTNTRNRTDCMAKTLYFANGDWSCTLSAKQKEAEDETFYYYSDERVWHEQKGDDALYRYPDGREEHIDAHGTLTVTHPSGDVRVSLGVSQR